MTYAIVYGNILNMNEFNQPETGEFHLTPNDKEESSAKCHICGSSLSYPELINFGNRCLFCAPTCTKPISVVDFLINAYYDVKIFNLVRPWLFLIEPCQDCDHGVIKTNLNDTVIENTCPVCNGCGKICVGRTRFLGHLGAVGVERYDQLNLKSKRELLKSIRGVK